MSGSASAQDLAAGRWSTLPIAPIAPRERASVVWTGHELLVWGGRATDGSFLGDGAAYDPADGRWRLLPRAPISAREGQASAWTGRELVVWGGYDAISQQSIHVLADGAAYRPDTNSWRLLSRSVLTPRTGSLAAWTGSEVVVVGGQDESAPLGDGARYDPVHDRWRRVPAPTAPPGHPLTWSVPVRAGARLLAWSNWTTPTSGGADLFVYRERSHDWHLVPGTPGAPAGVDDAYWTGRVVLVRGVGMSCGCPHPFTPETMTAYDPAHNVWTALPADPLSNFRVVSVWTGGALFSFQAQIGEIPTPPPLAEALDPDTGRLVRVADAPDECGWYTSPVWTGRQVLAYCPRSSAHPGRDGFAFGT